jgi:hypothetical protein
MAFTGDSLTDSTGILLLFDSSSTVALFGWSFVTDAIVHAVPVPGVRPDLTGIPDVETRRSCVTPIG